MAKRLTYNQLAQQVKRTEKQLLKLKEKEEKLREKHSALKLKAMELRESTRALRALLTESDKARRDLEERVVSNVKHLVLPYTNKLTKNGLDMHQMTYLNILQSNLNDIVSPFVHQLSSRYSALTPKEIQVAQLIKEGKNTRDTAELLGSSRRTIESHRQSIRTKLGVKNTKGNLRSHLLSM